MARPANPNKEKIAEIKSEIKDLNKTIRSGETAATKKEKMEARLAKLTGAEPVSKKPAKADKTAKTGKTGKKKVDAKSEKKAGKVVTQVKKRGRPKKVVSEDDEDDD